MRIRLKISFTAFINKMTFAELIAHSI